jgi:hypothetical protein
MEQLVIHSAVHGAVILMVGLVSGLPFARAIRSDHRVVAWRVVHSGGCMGGVMLLAVAGILKLVALPPWAVTLLIALLIAGTYLLVIGMVIGALTGDRGINAGGSPWNRTVHWLYGIGTVLALGGAILLLAGLALAAIR